MNAPKFSIQLLVIFIILPCYAMENETPPLSSLSPLIREIDYQGQVLGLALNPVQPQLAIGSFTTITLVNLDSLQVSSPITLDGKNTGVIRLLFNPLGTLLLYFMPPETGIINVLNQSVSHKTTEPVQDYQFTQEGNKVVMCMQNEIIIWDLDHDTKTLIALGDAGVGASLISRIFNANTFVHSFSNATSKGTVVWHLDNPAQAKAVEIDPSYATIFGNNENQLAAYLPNLGNSGHTIQLIHDQQTLSKHVDELTNLSMYCPESNKYLFALVNGQNSDVSVLMIDPETFDSKEICTLKGSSDSSTMYCRPYFSPDGKLFVIASGAAGSLKFCYLDVINNYIAAALDTSSPESSSN